MEHLKLGEILIEHGCITQEQLKNALAQQKTMPGKLLGAVLVETEVVSEEDIVVALATQFNVPYLPLANVTFSDDAQRLISKEMMKAYLCVPLDKIGSLITMVMADPTNEKAIQDIEAATQCKIQVFVATASEIAIALQSYFGVELDEPPQSGGSGVKGDIPFSN